MQPVITFALAKGRLAEQAFTLLEQLGIDCSEPRNPGRQLVLWDKASNVRFILVKPSDVPTYVDHGVADIGVVGKDTLLESGRPLYEVLDLTFGRCRLCIAGYAEQHQSATRATFRVATKYPNVARSYYDAKGQTIEIIELHGSVELGPVVLKDEFEPAPKVDSQVLILKPFKDGAKYPDELMDFIKKAFKNPRKKLKHNLPGVPEEYANLRPSDLHLDDYNRLFCAIMKSC